MVKQTTSQQIADLREQLTASTNNQEFLEEALSALEYQIQEQGWISLFSAQTGRELTKTSLNTLYDLARLYWLKNPIIRRSVEVQCLYVFGQGMTVIADDPEVDVVIQRFINDQKNYTSFMGYQARVQNERDLALSGNQFYAFVTTPDTGRVILRTIPLYEIENIVTNPEDRNEPWFYCRIYGINEIQQNGTQITRSKTVYHPDWRYNPDEKPATLGDKEILWEVPIYHVKTNCLPDMRYGVSELYSAIDWAKAYKRFMENWSKLVEAYASYAFNLTTKGGAGKVAAAKAKIQDSFARTNPNTGTAATDTYRPVASTMVTGEGVKLETVRTQGATTSADDARRLLLMVAAATGKPEHILSGDPSTSNLATAKAMERPLELQFLDRQQLWKDVWWDICQYVIDQAIKAGKLQGDQVEDEFTGDITYTLTKTDEEGNPISRNVSVTFPPLLEHDLQATATAIAAASATGVLDKRTVAGQFLNLFNVESAEDLLDKLWPPDREPVFPAGPVPGAWPAPPTESPAIEALLIDALTDLKHAET